MRSRIERWKHIYETDDNSISNALSKLTWDLAVFSCVVHMVRSAADSERGKAVNGAVLDMIATGFWSSTMQGIRRLAEPGPINGDRGVCSLGALIQDAHAARNHLTRQVFVSDIAGLNYNYEENKEREWQFLLSKGPGAVWIPREYDNFQSERRHELFDWLSGTNAGNSNPKDLIREDVFIMLNERLTRVDHVVEHVNTQIAHAATEASRNGRVLENWDIGAAKDNIKELAQLAELAGDWFCSSGIGTVLPTPQFDQFEHLEQPLFSGDKSELRQIWDSLDKEISVWHQVDLSQLGIAKANVA